MYRRSLRGMSLVDVVVGSALVLIIFAGLFGILRLSLSVAGISRAKAVATSLVNSRMEYIRSLSYDDIGTVGGIPSGTLAQYATTTTSGIAYVVRTYVVYMDDPADGTGASDTTGITTDYKVAKVTVSYNIANADREVVLISNVAPQGIETTTGGGTLRISTVDASGTGVSGASVRIVNATTSPAIDFTTFSDATGAVLLPGAPTSTEYEIFVSKDGYSSAQTYARDATNVNPTPGYLTVAAGQTTTGTFAIDLLTTLVLHTFSPVAGAVFTDTFSSASNVDVTNTVVSGGAVVLAGGVGTYVSSGSVLSTTTTPTNLASWISASSTTSLPSGTTVLVQVTDSGGTLLSDAVLPGNSIGFAGTIDLSSLATSTYPSLRLKALLTTDSALATPSLLDWQLGYTAGPAILGNVPVTLTGGKTIGSRSDGTSIYKTSVSTTTSASGTRSLELEWDLYQRAVTGYTVDDETPAAPYELLPGTTVDASLILTP